ncbi:ATP-dependent nuclease [Parageobacillus toebii]|jgi:putative ATP-dependent endonuclease of the OLD family|uniref:Uncharacterized protein n=2 Tax=Anoxybacillaceae TaxID=3120669 RepID=A0A150MT09_9BACL|nr:AAA family ATPase [Parageobacillus toebii]KYD27594.1 hypothetical protein B4110_3750 [Parageobacillus toebii]
MYISKISIKNYRNFGNKPFKMKLNKFTAIIGENNVGKTNLLDSIGLILSQDITMFKKRMLELEDINYESRKKFKYDVLNASIKPENVEFPEVEIQIILEGMNKKQLSVVGDWFCDTSLEKARLTYIFKPRSGFDRKEWVKEQRELIDKIRKEKGIENPDYLVKLIEFPIKQYEYTIYGGNDVTNRCDPYFLRMLKFELLDALRDSKRELIANGESKLLYKILNYRSEGAYEDIKEVLSSLDEKMQNNPRLKDIKETLVSQLNKLSLQEKEGYNNIDFHFSSPETGELLKKLSLIYGQDPITIERNGLGRNNLLYISLILSRLAEDKISEDICFRVVGIEEPEAHLHPHLQMHLATNIESINSDRDDLQIILTSHSSHITSSLNLDNIAILYKENNEIKAHYITHGFQSDKKGKNHRRYLEKYLDATKSNMFFARKIILVEGIAEQILIPKLFELHTGKTLERIGCNIVNVNGVAFSHFLEIIRNGYFIKCVVLTDGDLGTKTEERAEKLKEEYEDDYIKVEINKETFEKELIEANKTGEGKQILLRALKQTRIQKGPKYEEEIGDRALDTDSFFTLIEDYKSEFAFNLHEELKGLKQGEVASFNLPEYIRRAFDFLEG